MKHKKFTRISQRNPEKMELIRALASKDQNVSYEAAAAIAVAFGETINTVIEAMPTLSRFYDEFQFEIGESPVMSVDDFFDLTAEGTIRVWGMAGGASSNMSSEVLAAGTDMFFHTAEIESATHQKKAYFAHGNPQKLQNTMNRLLQEVLVKREKLAANALMYALSQASTGGQSHVIATKQAGRVLPDDISSVLAIHARIYAAWNKGTAVGYRGKRPTTMVFSPEVAKSLREIAYNPINTRAADGAAPANTEDGIAAPNDMRQQFFAAAGVPQLYGLDYMEINEFGKNTVYNTLFDVYRGATTIKDYDGGNETTFDTASHQLVLFVDESAENGLVTSVRLDEDYGGKFALYPQEFAARERKVGWWGVENRGFQVVDDRVITGLVVR